MDPNRISVRMKVFPGNTSDSVTYLPMIKALKQKNGYDRIISVADKGMNSTDNLSYIHFNGDGYVFSQILKGKKGTRYHEKMFEDDKFEYNKDRTYKYRVFESDTEMDIKITGINSFVLSEDGITLRHQNTTDGWIYHLEANTKYYFFLNSDSKILTVTIIE